MLALDSVEFSLSKGAATFSADIVREALAEARVLTLEEHDHFCRFCQFGRNG